MPASGGFNLPLACAWKVRGKGAEPNTLNPSPLYAD